MKKILSFLIIFSTYHLHAGDWPMWRYDAGRSACSPDQLPEKLELLWSRHDTQRQPVWDDPLNQDLMQFDKVFEPIVLGKTLYMGFNDCDKVVALNTETGEERWAYYVDGPVRLPPAAWKDRIYFTSDDGYLYCLSDNGELAWKFRGGPSERKILGNKRLISTWPARGGVVVDAGIVYFSAGIWPFMGTFIYALDA
ncbi:PQQ-binding-like beta-propeller repeat protein, partial [candidate division KSB1 bacterium]